ncbi:salivary glue protein Sgs-3-like [Hypanus sabinus]|uniref:salivary glue protein Sgs-3-like n=1 Tax=Hypanus sabinus TaxID=79690 RepID=UPI0028C39A7E|nr:salivary glue protein Sgs-3-like [Hypanus sabinus]
MKLSLSHLVIVAILVMAIMNCSSAMTGKSTLGKTTITMPPTSQQNSTAQTSLTNSTEAPTTSKTKPTNKSETTANPTKNPKPTDKPISNPTTKESTTKGTGTMPALATSLLMGSVLIMCYSQLP